MVFNGEGCFVFQREWNRRGLLQWLGSVSWLLIGFQLCERVG